MRGQMLKQKLRNGDRVYGTHVVNFGSPLSAGWTTKLEMDFAFICTEHIPIDRTEVASMCKLYSDAGISPMVRIPYPSKYWANMAIEGGAEGIVAPYVETVDEVKELVGSVKYRPIKGKFLDEMLSGSREPKPELQKYMEKFNKDLYVIIGVESVEAIRNLDSLLSVEGVDGVFLGPHDITCSMEIPEQYDNPEFMKTIVEVIRKCRQRNKGVGIHMDLTLPMCEPFFDAGMNFVLNNADTIKMMQKLGSDFQQLRNKYGDRYQKPGTALGSGGNMTY